MVLAKNCRNWDVAGFQRPAVGKELQHAGYAFRPIPQGIPDTPGQTRGIKNQIVVRSGQ